MTFTIQNLQFNISTSKNPNLYTLIVNKNQQFHSQYNSLTKQQLNNTINKYIENLDCNK